MVNELSGVLQKRKSALDASAPVWESKPEPSVADALYEGVTFGTAPSAKEWIAQNSTEEEEGDPLQEALQQLLQSRGPRPSHSPGSQDALAALEELRNRLEAQSQGQGLHREELQRREAELLERERKLRAELADSAKAEEARRNYPPPPWLKDVEGTLNVAVVGNSGVGKSLLINRLRCLQRNSPEWADVGVQETTKSAKRYRLPGDGQVRLWDLPGAGTEGFPMETYISMMGLRYFDSVLIVTAGRFTSTEIQLRQELEAHGVPFRMVRTKVDIDVWNNQADNGLSPEMTLKQIRAEFKHQHGLQDLYLVSSREPELYDMQKLRFDAFPGLHCHLDKEGMYFSPGWGGGWALPTAHSELLVSIQGHWRDRGDGSHYIVDGSQVHVTLRDGRAAVVPLMEAEGKIYWCQHWSIGKDAMAKTRRSCELRWAPSDLRLQPLVWKWLS